MTGSRARGWIGFFAPLEQDKLKPLWLRTQTHFGATLEQRVQVGDLDGFFRSVDPDRSHDLPPVLLLHGLVSQSYSWTSLLKALGKQEFRALAPDWIGSRFSAKPERW